MKTTGAERPQDEGGFGALVRGGWVHRDAYTDPAVFAAEMERIFMGTWVYVGHDSEIPAPGDFKSTAVGTEPVILVRDEDGLPRVSINRCSHRGASVCPLVRGNVKAFRCEYHGWTFGLDGELIGVPFSDEDLKTGEMGLRAASRVDSYRGFIFASFNPDVPALEDHLRDVLPYIDRFVEHAGDHALRVCRDANEAAYNGNWKMQLENNVDGYHLSFTHQSVFEVQRGRTGRQARYIRGKSVDASTHAFAHGHAVMDLRAAATEVLRERLDVLPGAPLPEADLDEFFGVEGAENLYLASTGPPMNISIFPNLNLGSINICEVHPLTVNRTRVVLRPLLLDGVPDNINRIRLRYHELGSGPAGFVQPDDLEMFERASAGLAAEQVDWLQMTRGESREVGGPSSHEIGEISDETPQRGQYRWWQKLMETAA